MTELTTKQLIRLQAHLTECSAACVLLQDQGEEVEGVDLEGLEREAQCFAEWCRAELQKRGGIFNAFLTSCVSDCVEGR